MSAEPKEVPMQTRSKTLPETAREALVDLAELQRQLHAQASDLEARAAAIRQRARERTAAHVVAIKRELQIPDDAQITLEPVDAARPERVTWREPVPAPAPVATKPEEPPAASAPVPAPVPPAPPTNQTKLDRAIADVEKAANEKPATTRKRRVRAPAPGDLDTAQKLVAKMEASPEPAPQAAAG